MSTSSLQPALAVQVRKRSKRVQCFVDSSNINTQRCRVNSTAAAIIGYKIVAVPVGGGANISVTGMGSPLTGGQRQFGFSAGNALSPGQQYTFYAYAINAAGQSTASAPVAYTAPAM